MRGASASARRRSAVTEARTTISPTTASSTPSTATAHRVPAAGEQQVAIVGTERRVGHDRYAGKPLPELGEVRQQVHVRRQHHHVHQPVLQHPAQTGRAAAGDQARSAARQCPPQRGERGPALQQRGDRGHRSLLPLRRPSRADRDEGAHHLPGALEHAAGVVVAQHVERLLQRPPLARGDPLVHLGTGIAIGALEQKEVAVLVDVPAAEAEMPVDDPDGPLER